MLLFQFIKFTLFSGLSLKKQRKRKKKHIPKAPDSSPISRVKDTDRIVQSSSEPTVRILVSNQNSRSGTSPQSLRRREVVLARISLYIAFVFLLCHIIRLIPNAYEMIQSFFHGVSILCNLKVIMSLILRRNV